MPSSLHFRREDVDLLGLSLKTFRWDFSLARIDLKRNQGIIFGDKETAWLRQLATTTVSQQSALEKIEVEFCPITLELYHWNQDSYSDEHKTYPWDSLEIIRDEILRTSGRDLSLYHPTCHKEYRQHCKERGDVSLEWIIPSNVVCDYTGI